ncbi:membrane dipeptidase [Corticibacterium sp. UT-5YL-CI-8]|nr:membrane dipeptidase [Tianweitania sp. UT-5YL-CI-8]
MLKTNSSNATLIIDALQYPLPGRRWFEEWRVGGVSCVHVTVAIWENASETLQRLALWRQAFADHGDLVAVALTGNDIEAIASSGRTAVVLGFQNTAPIEHDIELIGTFRDLGVRIMQLTYNLQNYIGAGYWEANDGGLSSRFGRQAVDEMNRVGVLVDLSHCGERTTLDAIEYSSRPVSITHSNAREHVLNPGFGPGRLKTTEALKALSARGGVLGVCPNRSLVANGTKATLEDFTELVARSVDLMGVDAIGLGTDYCAGHPAAVRTWWRYARWSREKAEIPSFAPHEGWQDWFRSPADFPNIVQGLRHRGFSEIETQKILGGNWLRLFNEAFEPAQRAKAVA